MTFKKVIRVLYELSQNAKRASARKDTGLDQSLTIVSIFSYDLSL